MLPVIFFDVYNCLLLLGIIQGLLITLLLLAGKRRKQLSSVFLAATLVIFCFYNFLVVAYDSRLFQHFPFLRYLPLNLILGLGPCIFFYTRGALNPSLAFRRSNVVHFVPVGCQVLYYTAVAFIPSIIHTQAGGVPIWRLVSLIEQLGGNLSMLIYSWFSLSLLLNLPGKIGSGSKLSIKSFDTLRILMSIFVLLWVAWFIYTMVDILFFQYELPLRAYYPLYLLVAVLTYTIGTVGYLHPPLIIALDAERPGTENKKNHSYLHEEDILKKLHVLQKTMQEQKLYRNPELTLAMFSSETGIGANVISFIINNRVGQSFTDWVNTFRVEEVKQLLVDPQFENLNLAGIAANAGFNSKATFNRVFKKLIGQTPTEYLESHRGQ